jgi:hypothetical protein
VQIFLFEQLESSYSFGQGWIQFYTPHHIKSVPQSSQRQEQFSQQQEQFRQVSSRSDSSKSAAGAIQTKSAAGANSGNQQTKSAAADGVSQSASRKPASQANLRWAESVSNYLEHEHEANTFSSIGYYS